NHKTSPPGRAAGGMIITGANAAAGGTRAVSSLEAFAVSSDREPPAAAGGPVPPQCPVQIFRARRGSSNNSLVGGFDVWFDGKTSAKQVEMRAAQSIDVKRAVGMPLEGVSPQSGKEQRGDNAHYRALGIDRTQFACLDTPLQHRAQQVHSAVDYLLKVKTGYLGKITGFGQHQLGNGAEARAHDPREQSGQLF